MSSEGKVRVLVVDDSALMRTVLTGMLRDCPQIEVVGAARDGTEAIELAREKRPDVVTLDVEMPGLSGIDTIPALLAAHKVPIVMVSSFTHEGAEVTLEALERGAVDFMPKPDKNQISNLRASRDVLTAKVLSAAQSRVQSGEPASPHRRVRARTPVEPARPAAAVGRCVAIGISTGGPQSLTRVISDLKPPIPPILIVQHMPSQFTSVFAKRLDRLGPVRVKEAEEGDRVLPDQILIAPGSHHLVVVGPPARARVSLHESAPVSGHRPSVDVLFSSMAHVFRELAVGIIMTGMGRDGVEGCKQILQAGGLTLAQDEATSIVFGMNKVAHEEGAAQRQFALDELAGMIESIAHPT